MISATFDSNIYVRALHFGGRAAALIGHAQIKSFRIDVSEPILDETFRVLREKFQSDGYSIHNAWLKLLSTCHCVLPTQTLNVIPDETDNPILECAVTAQSNFIVSEDKDLLRIEKFEGIRIVTIAGFFKVIE